MPAQGAGAIARNGDPLAPWSFSGVITSATTWLLRRVGFSWPVHLR